MNPKEMTNEELLKQLPLATCAEFKTLEYTELLRRLNEAESDKKIAAEGRRAGREEALAIIMSWDAEEPLDKARENYAIGDTGDYGVRWIEAKLREILNITTPGEMSSMLDRYEGAYWEGRMAVDQLERERDALRKENEELRKDKARLDWLEARREWNFDVNEAAHDPCRKKIEIRDAIDAARLAKESEVQS